MFSLLASAAFTLALAAPSLAGSAASTATPPPPPPQLTPAPASPVSSDTPSPSPAPVATPTERPLLKPTGGNSDATPTPPPDNRVGLGGVWEVQIQRQADTEYTHFNLKQSSTTLNGLYMDKSGKKFPLAGSVDGGNIRLIVSLPDGSTLLFQGHVDGTTDMLGLLTNAKEQVPFTAQYRPKEKWIDNVNAQPGGLGGPTGGLPGGQPGSPGGGGYPPR